jgi:KUP system potassium uptake protein
VSDENRFLIERLGPKSLAIRHVWIRTGYQERTQVPEALGAARRELLLERELDLEHAAYFISQIVVIPDEHSTMPTWQRKLFLTMTRNAANAADEFGLPANRTVSIGGQIPA